MVNVTVLKHATTMNLQQKATEAPAYVTQKWTMDAPFMFLTPETLVDYCQTRIRGLDEQVQATFRKQENRKALSDSLSKLADHFNDRDGIAASETEERAQIEAAFDAAIEAAGPNTPAGKALEKVRADYRADAAGGSEENNADVDQTGCKEIFERINAIQGDVNRASELEMIQLQSLVSQRQQALQVCTNLVSALGQQMQAIAQNVGK